MHLRRYMSLGHLLYATVLIIVAGTVILWGNEGSTFSDKHVMLLFIILAFLLTAKIVPYSEIIAYNDRVMLVGFGRRRKYSISYQSIRTIWAVHDKPFRDYWFLPLLYFLNPYGWKPFSKWRGWFCTAFSWADDAIAIETPSEKYLVSCVDVDFNAAKLQKLAGLESGSKE